MKCMLKGKSLNEVNILMERYPALEIIRAQLIEAIESMVQCVENGGKILVCGNGGSAADSLHIVGELMKSFVLKRKLSPAQQEALQDQFPDYAEYYIENLQVRYRQFLLSTK